MKQSELIRQLRLTPGYIALLFWFSFFVVSIGWIFLASFSSTREIFTNTILASGWRFENYIKAWTTNNLSWFFLNSLFYAAVSCSGVILIASPGAYVLGRKVFRGRGVITRAFLITMAIPSVMIIVPMYSILAQAGLVGNRFTLVIMYISSLVPFTIFFLMGFFSSLPGAIEEAATVDGCSQGRILWQIYMPMAQPGIITVTIFNFMNIWNDYFISLVFGSKQELRSLSVGLQAIIESMTYTGDWAGLFAAVMIVFLPTLFLYIFLSDKIIAGVTGGSVKG